MEWSELTIQNLIECFETHRLPKKEWTHEAHLIVAIWYAKHYSFEKALALLRTNIKAYNAAVGTPNTDTEGYHETLTIFWLNITRYFISQNNLNFITELCLHFIASESGSRSYPFQYYSQGHLFTVEARHNWVAPDIKNLPLQMGFFKN